MTLQSSKTLLDILLRACFWLMLGSFVTFGALLKVYVEPKLRLYSAICAHVRLASAQCWNPCSVCWDTTGLNFGLFDVIFFTLQAKKVIFALFSRDENGLN